MNDNLLTPGIDIQCGCIIIRMNTLSLSMTFAQLLVHSSKDVQICLDFVQFYMSKSIIPLFFVLS